MREDAGDELQALGDRLTACGGQGGEEQQVCEGWGEGRGGGGKAIGFKVTVYSGFQKTFSSKKVIFLLRPFLL